jgi:hypothetical protein
MKPPLTTTGIPRMYRPDARMSQQKDIHVCWLRISPKDSASDQSAPRQPLGLRPNREYDQQYYQSVDIIALTVCSTYVGSMASLPLTPYGRRLSHSVPMSSHKSTHINVNLTCHITYQERTMSKLGIHYQISHMNMAHLITSHSTVLRFELDRVRCLRTTYVVLRYDIMCRLHIVRMKTPPKAPYVTLRNVGTK